MMTAITNNTWMNPPIVVDVTIPNNQRTIRTSATVYNMVLFLSIRDLMIYGIFADVLLNICVLLNTGILIHQF